MATLKLPQRSRLFLIVTAGINATALWQLCHAEGLSLPLLVPAFFLAGFITDLLTGLAHFGFDYVWPDEMPILGPISVDFRAHHLRPTLDPGALAVNFTMGAYAGLPFPLAALVVLHQYPSSGWATFIALTLVLISLWMLGFHQIHSYAHMGSHLSPDEFNAAVVEISRLPDAEQKKRFRQLFDGAGIPPLVQSLQRSRLFLRPEVHWRHHINFESDFSSLNGWSDPLMNPLYGFIARRKKRALALQQFEA